MRIAFGYVRVSTEEQADSGLGLEAQRQRLRAYCEMKGLHLANVFEDPGLSGGKPLGNRPAGSRLLAEAQRKLPKKPAPFSSSRAETTWAFRLRQVNFSGGTSGYSPLGKEQ